jgi:hypothetical protein
VNHNPSFGQLGRQCSQELIGANIKYIMPKPLTEVVDTPLHNCEIINGIIWNGRFIISSSIKKFELGVCGLFNYDFASHNIVTEIVSTL